MRAAGMIWTGAERPPRCFRLVALAAAFLLLLFSRGGAEEAGCRYVGFGPFQVEGFDGADPFGLQFIVRDNRWVFGPSQFGIILICPSCPPTEVSKGVLALGRSPFLDPV